MKYDPDKHHRRSVRLKEYDYREPGAYFVTICTYDRKCTLGSVNDGNVTLSAAGKIVEQRLHLLPLLFPHIELDESVVMPNHLHAIIIINEVECRGEASANQICSQKTNIVADASPGNLLSKIKSIGTAPGSLSSVIQNFKSITSRRINRLKNAPHPLWQREFYEHVIRNDRSLDEIREYIQANPWNWQDDDYYIA